MSDHNVQERSKFLILIVDDLGKNLQVLGGILRTEGYKIALAHSGRQALDIVQERPPSLILLDVMMPGMDGFDVCRQLKSSDETKHIPVIFLTARTDSESVVKGFDTGAVDYVTKPFNKSELLARVNTQLQLKVALEKKTFAADPELHQPLTVLNDNLELFQGAFDPSDFTEKQQRYLAEMKDSIEKVQSLLKQSGFGSSES